ncbi:MAG TPA: YceI family protein [Chryseosolibacter sp.]|nr:YceI family protein [Chryseosolibacter sp.]
MKKSIATVFITIFAFGVSIAQEMYFTKNGHVDFFSSTPMEDIKADNNKVTSVLNTTTGDIEFSMLIMAFQFEKSLMQEHFNENYMESSTYPKSSFKGKITNFDAVNFKADGTYPAEVAGKLTIHGVTKDIAAKGTFTVKGGKINAVSSFTVKPEDYNISIPNLVRDKIAKEIKVNIDNTYEPYVK